jgi:hypothetical protein
MSERDNDIENRGFIPLSAKSAAEARRWIKENCPNTGADYYGYNKDGECVLMSTVRPKGSKAPVATATRNRAGRAVSFCIK